MAGATPSDAAAGGPLAGRHALVTGASRGIGLAIAGALAEAGASLSLLARAVPDEPPLSGPRIGWLAADVTDEAALACALQAAEAARGPVDTLVNNAGGAETAPLSRSDAAMVRRMLALNLESVMTLTRLVAPGMAARGSGRVINVASTAGLKGYPYVTAYVAAKHGVVGFTRALALEMARTGVTVNAVCPGYTETDLVRGAIGTIMARTGRDEASARAELAKSNPQGRMVRPDEVAAAVLYLASSSAGAVTGVALSVSGGETP
jgi:NAD(P)-dependent dehydrogenase (short-subunit alcohol dehydrogenase family)